MKKNFFFLLVSVLFTFEGFGQTLSKSYDIKASDPGFDLTAIDKLDKQMMDMYRAKSEKTEVVINYEGKTAVILLEAADLLAANKYPVDMDAVNKGMMMRSSAQLNQSNSYIWRITPDFEIQDITKY